ncbi:MAG: LysM peptidoglycan-binding domain-containing protein [Rhodothermaceae bacterium]|nr:LysM peptidoglycan-binding domain-containing protein [Rhodothermaceae bacterium]
MNRIFVYTPEMTTMKALRSTLILLIVLLIPVLLQAQTGDRNHTVQAGETLFSISREYNITVDELRRWNNIRNNTIIVGQRLIVSAPSRTAAPSRTTGPATGSGDQLQHTVRAGETLMAISRRYRIDVNEIRRANNLQSDALSVGQVLAIPTGGEVPATPQPEDTVRPLPPVVREAEPVRPATESRPATPPAEDRERSLVIERRGGSAYYTVRPGDTLFRIASSHNMTLNELRSLNNLSGDVIRVGQELLVRSETTAASIGTERTSGFGRFTTYNVERNDNLQNLLARFNMDRTDFESLNPGIDPDRLRPGLTVTVLEPPVSRQHNPYRAGVDAGDSDMTPVTRYSETHTGRTTTNGELYNPDQLTAAHTTLPLGSVVFVQNPDNGRGIYVMINDRIVDDSIRLSAAAYRSLGYAASSRQAAIIVQER